MIRLTWLKKRWWLYGAIVLGVLIILMIGLVVFRSTSFEGRTADWSLYESQDYGYALLVPVNVDIQAGGEHNLYLIDDHGGLGIVDIIANPAETAAADWLKEQFQVEAEDAQLGNAVAKLVTVGNDRHYAYNDGQRLFSITINMLHPKADDFIRTIELPAVLGTTTDDPAASRELILSPQAFVGLFYSVILPGADRLTVAPSITGDSVADGHIQALAEARGYRLQPVANVDLVSMDGMSVQATLADDWARLKAAAKAQGIDLRISSGYRSVASQTQIFRSRLAAQSINLSGRTFNDAEIAAGMADAAIEAVLETSSIPGYSKHHSGYAIDISQLGYGPFENFGSTPGFDWISADNFRNAKTFGFIPSYPDGVKSQGPDPEPWELVWIGSEFFVLGE